MIENNLNVEKIYSLFWMAMLASRRSSSVDELIDMVRPLVNMENSDPGSFANLADDLSDYLGNDKIGSILAEFIKDTIFCFKTKDYFGMSEYLCMADEWLSENDSNDGDDEENENDFS